MDGCADCVGVMQSTESPTPPPPPILWKRLAGEEGTRGPRHKPLGQGFAATKGVEAAMDRFGLEGDLISFWRGVFFI